MPDTITADLLLGRDSLTPGLLKAGKAASDASGNVGDLTRRLYELGKQRATPVVDLQDKAANAHLEEVRAKLDELGKKVSSPKIDPQDKAALASVASMRLQLDRLGRMVASPKVTLEGVDRAQAQLLRLDAQLSRMTVKRGLFSRIGGLFGGGGGDRLASGATGTAAAGGGGLLSALAPLLGTTGGGIGIGLAAALAAALAPAAIPLGLGALVGGGGLFGGITLGKTAATNLQALQTALKSATGKQKEIIRDQIAAFKQANAGPLAVNTAFTGLTGDLTSVFSGALTRAGPPAIGPGGRPIPGSGAPSFLTSLLGILRQLGGFVKTLTPALSGLFRASVPYLQTFVKFLEQATKIILPVFTHLLQEFQPLLPSISKGLLEIVKGFAGFLKALGPQGMQTSAKLFLLLAKAIELSLIALGKTIDFLAKELPVWAHNVAAWFDRVRHVAAATGDAIMHYWDTWRHNWAHIWDVIYQDTIGTVIRTYRAVTTWFNKLPGAILHALTGLGHSLYDFAKSALGDLLSGLKSVAPSVFSWAKNFITSLPSMFLHWLHMSPPHPGSAFYDLGANMMHHLEAGMQARAQKIGVGAALGGIVLGGGAGSAQKIAQGLLGRYGWGNQWAALNAVAMRESGWSTTARNPSSGAYGIAQFINGPGEYYQYGGNPNTTAGQVVGFFNYIKQRYGNPSAAWAHEQAFGWYGSGLANGVFTKPTLIGVGERGPELVNVRPLHGGGATAAQVTNVYVTVGHGTHPVAAAQELVKILNQGARNGVKLRTSILGPG